MKILLALLALLSFASSLPVLQPEDTNPAIPNVPIGRGNPRMLEEEEVDLAKCDPDPCPADEEEEAPSLEDSEEVVLTAEETQEVSTLEANETAAEDELVQYNKWSGWLNKWDKPVKWCFNCRRTALDGIYSVHNNRKEDRRWQYHAQTYPRGMLAAKQWWSRWTGWKKTFNIYRGGAVVVTIASFHNNGKEDRRFRLLFRKINLRAWSKKSWRWTGLNKYDGVLSKNCGTGWVMGLWSRYSNRHRDRQFNVLCGWIVRKRKPVKPKAAWVTKTKSVAKSTTVTNSVSVTRKK